MVLELQRVSHWGNSGAPAESCGILSSNHRSCGASEAKHRTSEQLQNCWGIISINGLSWLVAWIYFVQTGCLMCGSHQAHHMFLHDPILLFEPAVKNFRTSHGRLSLYAVSPLVGSFMENGLYPWIWVRDGKMNYYKPRAAMQDFNKRLTCGMVSLSDIAFEP